jgi:c-di-GMP-related signal transduction protein
MQQENFIVREPLLNSQERVVGYELRWQTDTAGDASNIAAKSKLVRFIADRINETEADSFIGDQILILAAPGALLKSGQISQLPSKGLVLAVSQGDLADEATVAAIRDLRSQEYSFSLRCADLATLDKTLLALFAYIEVSVDLADFEAQIEDMRFLELPSAVHLVARDVTTWQQFEQCASMGLYTFVGNLHLTPRQGKSAKELNPAQSMIIQLMEMVRGGEDVRKLEGMLKRDAALSYKLLRYINSAGFGLGCEIQSLKHAVTLLGYSPLYRWLALLFATATTVGYSPVLMQAAVIRGRFAELLGQAFLPKSEAENLFVAGMFSLLDRLLGMPMEQVLEKIQLSEPVSQALLSREGIYGPFLALAEACELNSPDIESMATSLCISPSQVSQAHLSALAWAQGLSL